MKDDFRYLTALGALALAQASSAALPTLTVKRAPAGMTIPQLQQNLSVILQTRKQEQAAQRQQAAAQIKTALAAIEPESKALNAALAKDARYTSLMDQASRISASKADAVTRAAQMKALFAANRVVFNDASRSANIKAAALQSKLGNVVVNPNLSFQLNLAPPSRTGALSSSGGGTPAIPDLTLQPPYDFEATDTSNGGLAYQAAKADANVDQGYAQMQSTIIGVAGDAYGSADIGQSIDVPDNVSRVEITVTTKLSWSGSVLSVLGVSNACTFVNVELWTSDLHQRLDGDGHHDCVVAPLGWYAEMSGDETRDRVFSLNVTGSTRHLVVLGDVFDDVIGFGAPGYADALAKAQISRIRVHFVK